MNRRNSAVSALFIFVNSLSGMGGYLSNGAKVNPQSFALVAIAVVGGVLGAHFGAKKFNNVQLRYLLAVVLIMASVKLFWV